MRCGGNHPDLVGHVPQKGGRDKPHVDCTSMAGWIPTRARGGLKGASGAAQRITVKESTNTISANSRWKVLL